jgi:hypothetical protein
MDDQSVEQGTDRGNGEQDRVRGTFAPATRGPEGDVEGHGRLQPSAPKVSADEDAEDAEDVQGHIEPPRDRDLEAT